MKTVRDWAWSIWSHWVTANRAVSGPIKFCLGASASGGWHKYLTRNQIQPIAEREGDGVPCPVFNKPCKC